MKIKTGVSKDQLLSLIEEHHSLNDEKKELLKFLLNLDSNFLNYSFGLGDYTGTNWDFMYAETKTYFIPALLSSNWNFSFGQTWLDESMLIVYFEFENIEKISEFVFNGNLQKDNRTKFNTMEIYLSNYDMKQALEQGIIADSPKVKWYVN